MGKQIIGYAACVIWDKIPLNLKEQRVYQFSKQLKPYLNIYAYTLFLKTTETLFNTT